MITGSQIEKLANIYLFRHLTLEPVSHWAMALGCIIIAMLLDQYGGLTIFLAILLGNLAKAGVIYWYRTFARLPIKILGAGFFGGVAGSLALLIGSVVLPEYELVGAPLLAKEEYPLATIELCYAYFVFATIVLSGVYRAYHLYLSDPEVRTSVPHHLIPMKIEMPTPRTVLQADSVLEVCGYVSLPAAATWEDIEEWVQFELGQGKISESNPLVKYDLVTFRPATALDTKFRKVTRKIENPDGTSSVNIKFIRR